MYLCVFVVRCLMVYDAYLLCELYPLSLKIFIFASLKKKDVLNKSCWNQCHDPTPSLCRWSD